MDVPEDRRYTDQHEWVLATDNGFKVGITDFAQDALGDVVFVDIPAAEGSVAAGDILAEVESTKSVGEVYAPFDGTIVAANQRLAEEPELVNSDPYGEGWFVELTGDDPDLAGLLEPSAYRELTESD